MRSKTHRQQDQESKSIDEAIRRLAAEAVQTDELLHAADEAANLAKALPACGLTKEEIAEKIIVAAISAGVTTEMSKPSVERVAAIQASLPG